MVVGVFILGTTLALVVLPVQVALGRFTVTALLEPIVVTAHLGTAIIIALALTVTTVSAWLHDHSLA
jgi:heme A synthase